MAQTFFQNKIVILVVLLSLLFVSVSGIYYVVISHKGRGIYVCDLHTLYYDPQQGKDICGSFQIKNDFSKEPIQLELAGRSCSCISVDISPKQLGRGETSSVKVFFRTDSSVTRRNELVVLKTSHKNLPVIQLITKVNTVPFLYVEIPDKNVPRLKPGEKQVMPLKAFACVDSEKDIGNVALSVEGTGFSLKDIKQTVRKINGVAEVEFRGELAVEFNDIENYRSRNDGSVVIQRGKFKAYSDVSWIPVVPFRIEPDVVFVSSANPKKINLTFEHPVQILKIMSSGASVAAVLEDSSKDNTLHTISIKKINDDSTEDVEILIETDMPHFANIRVPVCIVE